MKTLIQFIVVLWMVLVSAQALALRCGTQIILPGDSKFKLREACGKPALIEHLRAKTHWSHIYGNHPYWGHTTTIQQSEVWYYNRGSTDFVYVITIEDGLVKAIDTDGYGD